LPETLGPTYLSATPVAIFPLVFLFFNIRSMDAFQIL
jgi:hypothetical protein